MHSVAAASPCPAFDEPDCLAAPPPILGGVSTSSVPVVWQNILQSDILQVLSGINVPKTGVFIDYRYWANGVFRWAVNQKDANGDPLYVFGIPSWETGFDENNNPVVGAFLFPVGTQVTFLNPTDTELNQALAAAYGNKPPLTLTTNQTGDPDERRWAAAAHAYALSQTDANGNPYVAGIPSWEMAIQSGQTYRGVYAFSGTPGIQVLKAGRAALMDQIAAGILEPADNPNLMDTDMRTLAVAANRWAMRYGAGCGAGTFGYCSSACEVNNEDNYFVYTHDIVICFAARQPTGDLLQSIVDQPAVAWPVFDNAYSELCVALGNILAPGSGKPIDPRSLAIGSPSWDPDPVTDLLVSWLKFDVGGGYTLSPSAPDAPAGVTADDWLQIIYTVWQEMSSVEQLQALYAYTKTTLNTAQITAQDLINGAIANLQAKTDNTTLLDFGQLLKDLGYSLVWFFPGAGAAWANIVVTAVTDVIRVVTSSLGGASTNITIGQYWENVAASFEASISQLDAFYATIASDHGRLIAFYAYADNGSLSIPADGDAATVTAMANGAMQQTYQNLMPLFWSVGWGWLDDFNGNQVLYGDYDGISIPRAPEGTYVEGSYYEMVLIWSGSGAIKSYPTDPMMTDLTTTLNINLMDVLARTGPWINTPSWMGWVGGYQLNLQGPYTR
jgi:hypothetical protein